MLFQSTKKKKERKGGREKARKEKRKEENNPNVLSADEWLKKIWYIHTVDVIW